MKFCSNIFSFFPTVRFATLRYISKHTSNSIIIDKKKTAFPVDTLMFLERAHVHTQYVCVYCRMVIPCKLFYGRCNKCTH